MMIFLVEMLGIAGVFIFLALLEKRARGKFPGHQWVARLLYQLAFMIPIAVMLWWLVYLVRAFTYPSAILLGIPIGLFGLDLLKLLKRKMK